MREAASTDARHSSTRPAPLPHLRAHAKLGREHLPRVGWGHRRRALAEHHRAAQQAAVVAAPEAGARVVKHVVRLRHAHGVEANLCKSRKRLGLGAAGGWPTSGRGLLRLRLAAWQPHAHTLSAAWPTASLPETCPAHSAPCPALTLASMGGDIQPWNAMLWIVNTQRGRDRPRSRYSSASSGAWVCGGRQGRGRGVLGIALPVTGVSATPGGPRSHLTCPHPTPAGPTPPRAPRPPPASRAGGARPAACR